MQQIFEWLLAQRMRLAVVMAALFLIPLSVLVSGALAAAVVLNGGFLAAAPVIGAAALLVAVGGLAAGGVPAAVGLATQAIAIFAFAALAASVMRATRSLTMCLQLMSVVAVVGVALVYLQVDDVSAMWLPLLEVQLEQLKAAGLNFAAVAAQDQAAALAMLATIATGLFALMCWFALALMLLLGYHIFDRARDEKRARFGRFRDLNLGRVLAIVLAVLAIVWGLTKQEWAMNAAFALLFIFSVQGIALMHWLRHRYDWPTGVMVIGYGLLIVPTALTWVATLVVCIGGYVDAWFNMVRSPKSGRGQ